MRQWREQAHDVEDTSGGEVMAVTKREGGMDFPARDYAYVPDSEAPSTWKLRLTAEPGGTPDPNIVGAAAAALGPGFRGQKAQVPAADLPAVKAKVRAAWRKANPDKDASEMPAGLREAEWDEWPEFEEAATFKATIQGLVKAAHAVAGRKGIPKAVKDQIAALRALLKKAYPDMTADSGAESPVEAAEASGDTSDNTEEPTGGLAQFAEEGQLVEAARGEERGDG